MQEGFRDECYAASRVADEGESGEDSAESGEDASGDTVLDSDGSSVDAEEMNYTTGADGLVEEEEEPVAAERRDASRKRPRRRYFGGDDDAKAEKKRKREQQQQHPHISHAVPPHRPHEPVVPPARRVPSALELAQIQTNGQATFVSAKLARTSGEMRSKIVDMKEQIARRSATGFSHLDRSVRARFFARLFVLSKSSGRAIQTRLLFPRARGFVCVSVVSFLKVLKNVSGTSSSCAASRRNWPRCERASPSGKA